MIVQSQAKLTLDKGLLCVLHLCYAPPYGGVRYIDKIIDISTLLLSTFHNLANLYLYSNLETAVHEFAHFIIHFLR